MSALQVNSGDKTVDPGHQLEMLIGEVAPHLKDLLIRPVYQPIIDLNDKVLMVVCEPINKVYVMTTLGLAYIQPLRLLRRTPRLLGHVGISLIESRHMAEITKKLSLLRGKLPG